MLRSSLVHATFLGCQFTGNVAVGSGGAIFARDVVSVEVFESSFDSNESDGRGGAIYVYQEDTWGVLTIHESVFLHNIAGESGGAVYRAQSSTASPGVKAELVLTNTSFTYNEAGHPGGALFTFSRVTLSNCSFTRNNAWRTLGGAWYHFHYGASYGKIFVFPPATRCHLRMNV